MGKLKVINLSHSANLVSAPNLEAVPNLEELILEDCVSLLSVHPSVARLQRLVALNMRNCKNRESIPDNIWLEALRIMTLSGCSKLNKFPDISGNMGNYWNFP